MKEILVNLIDTILGPTLDRLGSRPDNERWIAPNVSRSDLVDNQSGEVVGEQLDAVRDGIASITKFSQPTALRKNFKAGLTKLSPQDTTSNPERR